VLPLRFEVNAAATDEGDRRRRGEGAEDELSCHIAARLGSFLDPLQTAYRGMQMHACTHACTHAGMNATCDVAVYSRLVAAHTFAGRVLAGLANFILPEVQLGQLQQEDSLVRMPWLGMGMRPQGDVSVKTVGNAICSSCDVSGRGPLDQCLHSAAGQPIVEELMNAIVEARIDFISVMADNGNRREGNLLGMLGYTGECASSARGGVKCRESVTPRPPLPDRSPAGAIAAMGPGREAVLRGFLETYRADRLTHDLRIDTMMTTPGDGLAQAMGRLVAGGPEPPSPLEQVSMRLEVINVFNKTAVEREYCQVNGSWYRLEPPVPLSVNVELAARWQLHSLPVEIALRREAFSRQQLLHSSIVCKDGNVNGIVTPKAKSQSGDMDSWWIIFRLPRVTALQIVCVARGIDAEISADNSATTGDSKRQECVSAFDDEFGYAPKEVADALLGAGISASARYGDRQGPLVPADG